MKWAIREAIDVYFKAKSVFKLGARTIRAGEPVLIFDTVKTSTLETSSDVSYVTGGRGNARLLSYEGDKALTFNFEDALLSNEGLAILAGADLIPARNSNLYNASPEARSVISHFTETVKIKQSNKVDKDPTNNFPPDPALYVGGDRTEINGTSVKGEAKYSEEYKKTGEAGAGVTASNFTKYIDYSPRGGELNVWLTKKPYVGQNASIYVMLLDSFGEMSGAPIEVSLSNNDSSNKRSFLAKWEANDYFVAFSKSGKPIGNPEILLVADENGNPASSGTYTTEFDSALTGRAKHIFKAAEDNANTEDWEEDKGYTGMYYGYFTYEDAWADPSKVGTQDRINGNRYNPKMDAAAFDDVVGYYVDLKSAADNWLTSWGPIEFYIRQITAQTFGQGFKADNNVTSGTTVVVSGQTKTPTHTLVTPNSIVTGDIAYDARNGYAYLLAPSGGVAQPKAFRENGQFVYKVNVPSILYEDMVLVDYYVEYKHNATQVSILPDKFGPYMYVEGESLVRRASDGMDLPVSFVIPKFKITTALTFTLQSTGDASTFTFSGDAYPDYSKFDMSRKVLADIQILDADDNYDNTAAESAGDPTDYRRYRYNDDTEGEYLWKDPSIEQHSNIDYSDPNYLPDHGGPVTKTVASDIDNEYSTYEVEGGASGGAYNASNS